MKTLFAFIITVIVTLNCIAQETGTFTDSRDGQVYKTVKIDNQTWMAENLNFKSNGGSWCYENEDSHCDTYGRLYTWQVANSICPSGWRLPSKEDFENLLKNVGGSGSNAYQALMEGGSSGFNALMGGWRSSNSNFKNLGDRGYWWSSSQYIAFYGAWDLSVYREVQAAGLHERRSEKSGKAVRCLKKD